MTINISFFASLTDVFDRNYQHSFTKGESISDIVAYLKTQKPEATPVFEASRYAINDVFVDNTYVLKNEDHLLILPPSSGG